MPWLVPTALIGMTRSVCFDPRSPLANEAGIGILTGSRDYDKMKRDLKDAGYRGEPIVGWECLATAILCLYRKWVPTSCARAA